MSDVHTSVVGDGAGAVGAGAEPPVVAPARVFACSVPCVHCGYELRTMRLSGACPECGRACRDSLRALALVRVEDLARVRRGLIVMILAAVGMPLSGVLTMFGVYAYDMWARTPGWEFEENLSKLAAFGVFVGGPALSAFGAFRLSGRLRRVEVEGEAEEVEPRGWAVALRWCAVVFAALTGSTLLLLLAIDSWRWLETETMAWTAGTLVFLAAGAGVCRNFTACAWMRRVARRGNSPRLARWLAVMQWAAAPMLGYLVLLAGAILLVYFFSEQLERAGANNSRPMIGLLMAAYAVFSTVGSIGFLGWAIAWAVTLPMMDRCLRAAVKIAAMRGRVVEG